LDGVRGRNSTALRVGATCLRGGTNGELFGNEVACRDGLRFDGLGGGAGSVDCPGRC
jgi:hypothetical protein